MLSWFFGLFFIQNAQVDENTSASLGNYSSDSSTDQEEPNAAKKDGQDGTILDEFELFLVLWDFVNSACMYEVWNCPAVYPFFESSYITLLLISAERNLLIGTIVVDFEGVEG